MFQDTSTKLVTLTRLNDYTYRPYRKPPPPAKKRITTERTQSYLS